MPSTRKKSPASAAKKKTPASTKNKNSVKKPGKKSKAITVNDGSYLQNNNIEGISLQAGVNTITDNNTMQQSDQQATLMSTNQSILAMLQKLDASNQVLTRRIDGMERQRAVSSTPLASPTSQRQGDTHTVSQQQGRSVTSATQASSVVTQGLPVNKSGNPGGVSMVQTEAFQNIHRGSGVPTYESRDAVAPRLDVMRSIPSISSAVSHLLVR